MGRSEAGLFWGSGWRSLLGVLGLCGSHGGLWALGSQVRSLSLRFSGGSLGAGYRIPEVSGSFQGLFKDVQGFLKIFKVFFKEFR